MVKAINLEEQLVDELFRDSEQGIRCPHVQRDKRGAYCGRGLNKGKVEEHRRMVCDTASLQLWCLASGYAKCVYFKGEESV